jgi:long-chain acyl-CoA synthetase
MLSLSRLSSIGEALRDAVLTYKTHTALIEVDRQRETARLTYSELRAQAEHLASHLEAHGFKQGERCAILMSNQSKWSISGLAAFWAGAVLVPLDYKLTPEEQLALIQHAKPKVLIVEYPVFRLLQKLDLSALERTRVIVTEAPERAELGPAHRFEKLDPGKFEIRHPAREDVACIVYSSGTSGTPKGCMLTHANYLAQAEVLGRMFPMREEDRYFSILPTNHAIDFMCGFFMTLLFGAAVVHQRTLRPEFLLPTMRDYEVSHMALVPRILKALETRIKEQLDERESWQRDMIDRLASVNQAATQRGPRHELSRVLLKPIHDKFGGKLRLIFAGGAFVERENAEYFYRLGLPVVIGYGLTEAGTVLTVNDLKPFRADTVGPPVTGCELEVRNANDEGVGEIWVRGPTVMKGYLEAPALTAEALVDGWLRTGDLGLVDAAGHLKLFGRSKNMIVTEGGKNVYPEDIENAFAALADVEEYCVFAANFIWADKRHKGEQLVMALRLKTEASFDADLLSRIRDLNRTLSAHKRLHGVVLTSDEFPRTASQKIKRELLAQQLAKAMPREGAIVAL